MARKMYFTISVLALLVVVVLTASGLSNAQSETSPPPDLTATAMAPTPTAEPTLSAEAHKARQHVSEQTGIPVADLLVVNDRTVTYPLLGRSFRLVTVFDTGTPDGQEHILMIDPTDGAFVDIDTMDAAEEKAAQEKYGKLEPALYERLQEIGEEELLPVAFWFTAGPDSLSREEINNILVSRYPEAAQALAKWGEPWAVEDPELRREIRDAYRQLRDESVTERVSAVVTELQDAYGVVVTTYPGMPSVSATLSKEMIELLAKHPDVAVIYLIEEPGAQAMDTAAWTDRAHTVWGAGYTGAGRRIATIELNRISSQVPCLTIASTVNPGLPLSTHHTHVASVAACNSDLYPGIARGAQLVDAGFSSTGNKQTNAIQALQQALVNHNADAANISYVFEYDRNLNWTDRAFDYWARSEDTLIVAAIGNRENNPNLYPGSPSKGWNVLTVGGSNDSQNAYWADDDFAEGSYIPDIDSAYLNPISNRGDREKPEVVAPAWSISAHAVNSSDVRVIRISSGTSLAAPQVAGLAALLLQRNAALVNSATALRSIIMASAIHNVDGPSDIITGLDLKDGAGGIDNQWC